MPFPRRFLILSSVLYVSVGLCFVAAPDFMAGLVEIEGMSAAARTDVRATYGGLDLGVGAFVAWCAADPDKTRVGLAASVAGLVGLGLVRLLGMALDGPTAVNVGLLTVEVVFAAVGLWAWHSEGRPAAG